MAAPVNYIVWIDEETTGLRAHEKHLLEVACIITDTSFNVLTPDPFHAVIGYEEDEARGLYLEADPVVRAMHEKTGLWDKILDGQPLLEVDAALLAFIKEHAPNAREGYIAGNSTRLDLNFIDEHLPGVGAHLHYQMLDVSVLALLVGWEFGVHVSKGSDHSALTDITESIAQLHALWDPIAEVMRDRVDLFATETPLAAANRKAAALVREPLPV